MAGRTGVCAPAGKPKMMETQVVGAPMVVASQSLQLVDIYIYQGLVCCRASRAFGTLEALIPFTLYTGWRSVGHLARNLLPR